MRMKAIPLYSIPLKKQGHYFFPSWIWVAMFAGTGS